MFSLRLSLPVLIEFSRALKHMLGAGLTIQRAMTQQAERGSRSLQPIAERLAEELQSGTDLHSALKNEAKYFPPLFIALVGAAEKSGRLPEVLTELQRYYSLVLKVRRDFRSRIFFPVVQFCLAIFIVTGLIAILGIIAQTRGGPGLSVMGLSGVGDAVFFLASVVGTIAAVWGLYKFSGKIGANRPAIDRWLLSLPAVGPCLEAFCMARFAMALEITMETGMPLRDALKLSLEATGNAALAAAAPKVRGGIQKGKDLSQILERTRLFPTEFIEILATAEVSGQISETMRHQAEIYFEIGAHRLKYLARIFAGAIYGLVMLIIIFFIFSIATQVTGQYEAF